MTSPNACPEPADLHSLVQGTLPADAQESVTRHLESCESCQDKLEALAADSDSWATAARHAQRHDGGVESALQQILQKSKADPIPSDSSEAAELPLDFLGPPEKPGQLGRLSHYEVLEVIGRGGMGIVLKAFDQTLQRVVAIKVMAPQLATSSTARKRFIREAVAAAAVRHEHVVGIHAVDEEKGAALPGDGVHRRHLAADSHRPHGTCRSRKSSASASRRPPAWPRPTPRG